MIPLADVTRRHVDSAAKARAALSATHVVAGPSPARNGRVVLHAFLTDTRTQANSGDCEGGICSGRGPLRRRSHGGHGDSGTPAAPAGRRAR